MANYADYKNAITQATGGSAPAAMAPTDNLMGSHYGKLLSNFNNINYQLPAMAAPLQALNFGTAQDAAAEAQAASEARNKEIQSLNQQIQDYKDMHNPSKFQQVAKPDGGYDFFDPKGNKIDLNTYSQITGKSPADILKGSENLLDKQYTNDYGNMEKTINAFTNGDQKFFDDMKKNDPASYQKVMALGQNDQERMVNLMKSFKGAYPNVYGGQGTGAVGQPASYAMPQNNMGGSAKPGFDPVGWLTNLFGRL